MEKKIKIGIFIVQKEDLKNISESNILAAVQSNSELTAKGLSLQKDKNIFVHTQTQTHSIYV